MDSRISPHSTGLRPLPGPLPKKRRRKCKYLSAFASCPLPISGIDVPIISGTESFVSKSDPNATEAPLPGFRKSYERFSNHLGWKTKAQVFGKSNEPNLTQNGES